MRTPSLACALFAAAAFTPVFVAAAPFPAPGSYSSDVFTVSHPPPVENSQGVSPSPRIGTKFSREAAPDHRPQLWTEHAIGPRALDGYTAGGDAYSGSTSDVSGGSVTNEAEDLAFTKRTTDDGTLGGNAYTGKSSDVNGGDVVNQSNNFGMPTLMNMNSNNAGDGGESASGCAAGGHGNGRGSGGNAYSGSSGNAIGGSVYNSGGMMNFDSNNGGDAGSSTTGCATGGDVSDQAP